MYMNRKDTTPKRLILNVNEIIHKKIKLHATFRNTTITQYVLQAVIERMAQEDEINKGNKYGVFTREIL